MTEAMAQTASSSDSLLPRVLLPVKKPELLDAQWKKHLCDLPELICDESSSDLQLYQAKGGNKSDSKGHKSGQYFLLFNNGLILAQLQWGHGHTWQLDAVWDFRSYPHSRLLWTHGETDSRLHPDLALYPSAPGKWAVAVISSARAMYSGGGAECSVADFVELPLHSSIISAKDRLYGGVPFYDETMIRACFSEEDYRRKGHCHDETRSWLTLKVKPSTRAEHYDWLLSWHEENWPAGVPKKNQTTTVKQVELEGSDSAAVQKKKLETWTVCNWLD